MDINILINQHIHWKNLVQSLFDEENSEILNPTVIVQDDHCELGKWINSEDGKKLLSEHGEIHLELAKLHKDFHYLAGAIVFNYQAGNSEKASQQIGIFNQTSDELIQLLSKLK